MFTVLLSHAPISAAPHSYGENMFRVESDLCWRGASHRHEKIAKYNQKRTFRLIVYQNHTF